MTTPTPEQVEYLSQLCARYDGAQLQATEFLAIYRRILQASRCRLLVFGLGNDAPIWRRLNPDGRTVFLEHDPDWFARISSQHPELECHRVAYRTRIGDWEHLLDRPDLLDVELPAGVGTGAWDVILVDAPTGYDDATDHHGRMSSIYMASRLVAPGGRVFVHDAEREVESAYCDRYLGRQNRVGTTLGRAQLNEYLDPRPALVTDNAITIGSHEGSFDWNGSFYDGYIVLSVKPLILIYTGSYQDRPESSAPPLPDALSPDVVIEMLSWWGSEARIRTIGERYAANRDGVTRMLMTNTPEEDARRIALGIDGFVCNKEIFALEEVFRPVPGHLRHNAIYVARLAGFKRHYLATKIDGLRLLTSGVGESLPGGGLMDVGPADIARIGFRDNVSACFDWLDLNGVCTEINQAICGLALSAEEGMMRVSTQYLLCGRPVVSTRSLGGREMYYDDGNAILVDDYADAVAAAVHGLYSERRDPMAIRHRTLNRINGYRYRFARTISGLRLRFGGTHVSPERILHDLFFSDRRFYSRHLDDPGVTRGGLEALDFTGDDHGPCFTLSERFSIHDTGTGHELNHSDYDTPVAQLNESGAWILQRMDGATPVESLVAELTSGFPHMPLIGEQARDAIAAFIHSGILVPPGSDSEFSPVRETVMAG